MALFYIRDSRIANRGHLIENGQLTSDLLASGLPIIKLMFSSRSRGAQPRLQLVRICARQLHLSYGRQTRSQPSVGENPNFAHWLPSPTRISCRRLPPFVACLASAALAAVLHFQMKCRLLSAGLPVVWFMMP